MTLGSQIFLSVRRRWYVIVFVLVKIVVLVPFFSLMSRELSIVKIPTEYGTLELTENVGMTKDHFIDQSILTQDGVTYTLFFLSRVAETVPVSAFSELNETEYPSGTQSGHEILFVFDGNPATEEVLYFDIIVDIDGVRWDQVIIYSGGGQQLKVLQSPPTNTTGVFFVFLYQSEIERGTQSFIFQFKGFHYTQARNVFITTYYSLAYSYLSAEETTEIVNTTTTTQGLGFNPFFASDIGFIYILPFLMIITALKRRKYKGED